MAHHGVKCVKTVNPRGDNYNSTLRREAGTWQCSVTLGYGQGEIHISQIMLCHAGAAGLVNAVLIGMVLLWLTPVAQHLPLNALAAIVIMGVIGLLDFGQFLFLLRVSSWV